VKLPPGVSSMLVERGPNPKNENSAVWVTYQVRALRCIRVGRLAAAAAAASSVWRAVDCMM
jgi:hypothetical protein